MIKCIAIDDEQMALDIITTYISKVPSLDLKGSFVDALEAMDFLQKETIDLLFIDINMPDLTGIQFLKSLPKQPLVIFTTAYSEYAAESFDYNVVDYLLKPIEFERFVKATNKVVERKELHFFNQDNNQADQLILLKSGTDVHQVKSTEILFIESYGNYVKVHTKKDVVISLLTMKQVMNLIHDELFVQVHKSYIVAMKQITKIEKHQVNIGDKTIPIGKVYKALFINKMGL